MSGLKMVSDYIPIGQPILVQDYILQVLGKPFLDALTNGNTFRAMGLNKNNSLL